MSYGADVGHLFRRSAFYIDNILKGTKPSDLPVQQVTTVELLAWIDQIVVLSWLVPAGLALVYSAPSPPGPYRIHRTRLAVPVWSLAQGSIFAAPLAPIVRAAARLGGRGLIIIFYVLPHGVGWFAGAALLAIASILLAVPRRLR